MPYLKSECLWTLIFLVKKLPLWGIVGDVKQFSMVPNGFAAKMGAGKGGIYFFLMFTQMCATLLMTLTTGGYLSKSTFHDRSEPTSSKTPFVASRGMFWNTSIHSL